MRWSVVARTGWLLLVLLCLSAGQAQADVRDFLEVEVSHNRPFVGEALVYTVRWFQGQERPESRLVLPDFTGFVRTAGETYSRTTQIIDGTQYLVSQTEVTLFARESGILEIAPAEVVARGVENQPEELVISDAISVDVRPLPAVPPDTFQGAVGQFEIDVLPYPTDVVTGQPLTLQLRLNGRGNFEQIIPPRWNTPEGWQIFQETPVIRRETPVFGRMTFYWTLIPSADAPATLPPVVFSYFDPQTETYQTLTAGPFQFTITESSGEQEEENDAAATITSAASDPEPPALKPVRELRPFHFRLTPVFWLAWLIAPSVALIAWALQRRNSRALNGAASRTKGTSLRGTRRRLEALRTAPSKEAYERAAALLAAYLNRRTGGSFHDGHHQNFAALPLPEALRRQVERCFAQLHSARYAPMDRSHTQRLLSQVIHLLERIEKHWGAQR